MPFVSQRISISQALRQDMSYGTEAYPNILHYFRKTPASIVCPHFWELRWAYGCPFACAYCYLQGTLRGKKEPRYIPVEHVLVALNNAFEDENLKPSIFNSGELADSLMNPAMMEKIADKFEEQTKHKLLLLTKSANTGFLVKRPRKQTIVSITINNAEVWKRWEHKTPPPEKRIEAAKAVSGAGYEVRVRIDPIFPIDGWKEVYGELIDYLLSELWPDRITLGMPRGLAKTFMFSKDLSWAQGMTEKSGWGKKFPEAIRKEVYSFFLARLTDSGFEKGKIAVCKETVSLWRDLRMGRRCNCVW